jgi:hypothetical protein
VETGDFHLLAALICHRIEQSFVCLAHLVAKFCDMISGISIGTGTSKAVLANILVFILHHSNPINIVKAMIIAWQEECL